MVNSKFDDLLTKLGTGKYNLLYFFTAAYWYFLLPPQFLSGVYLAPATGHTCRPPANVNTTDISEDSCLYYLNVTTPSGNMVREEVSCTEWDFDTSVYTSTLTSEFKLVCDHGYLRATYQSIALIAPIFSGLLVGYIADKYGRKMMVVVSISSYSILCNSLVLATNFTAILGLRFLQGCASLSILYILSLEVCEVKNRSLVGIVLGLPWALGTIAWGGIAYFIRDWRYLQLAVSLPFLLIFPFFFFMDESPRWLILQGDHQRALKILRKAARWNKVELPPDHELRNIFLDIQQEQNEGEAEENCASKEIKKEKRSRFITMPKLLRTPKIRLLTVVLAINLFILSLVFSGLSLSGDTYEADPFLYVAIGGLMEVPSYTLTAPLINWLGRKRPTIIGYFISGLTILVLAFIPSDISWLVFTLAMLGKMSNCASYMIMWVYMPELLPTEVRMTGNGVTGTVSCLAAVLAPYITDYLGPIIPWFPSVLFGLSSFVAALVLLPLPETLGMAMWDTIDDLEGTSWKHRKSGDLHDDEENKMLVE